MSSPAQEFVLKTAFIELDNLLKVLNMAHSGAEAKMLIQEGRVKVNGDVEMRVRRKLRKGDEVVFGDVCIRLK